MILAFGNKARQGKDTAGEAVVDYYNLRRSNASKYYASPVNFEQLFPEARLFKFADALYEACRTEYGMTEKDTSLLQKVGNGRRNEFGPDYWIKQLEPKVKAFNGIAVITDVRYTNEAEWIKNLGGHTINVRRILENGESFITDDRDPNHPSETGLDGYNYDFYISSKSAALTGEMAITIVEYLRGLETK